MADHALSAGSLELTTCTNVFNRLSQPKAVYVGVSQSRQSAQLIVNKQDWQEEKANTNY